MGGKKNVHYFFSYDDEYLISMCFSFVYKTKRISLGRNPFLRKKIIFFLPHDLTF